MHPKNRQVIGLAYHTLASIVSVNTDDEVNEQYLCHEVRGHARLRWHKFLLHNSPTLLKARSDGSVSDDILYVAVSSLHTRNVLTALSCKLTNNTCVY